MKKSVNYSSSCSPEQQITTIIPVYKSEKYLRETINSVISQTIGFESHISIILVDDGSPDDSARICREYEKNYPRNITYTCQENAGVSVARNRGLVEARGRYVHFLDSDDIISPDFYQLAVDFLQDCSGEVDFAATKIKLFDANIDEHPNNYKFHKTRVIDVTKDPDNPIQHVSSCLFVAEALQDVRFDADLKMSEDGKFVADILKKKRKYGVLARGCLHYRRRSDRSSAISGQLKNKEFYAVTPTRYYGHLFDTWRDSEGTPADYVQCVFLYDLMWRLEQAGQSVLSRAEEKAYKDEIKSYIRQLSDRNIITKRGLSLAKRVYILRVKYGELWGKKLVASKGSYAVNGATICRAKDDSIHLDFITTNAGEMTIEGYSEFGVIEPNDTIILRTGDEESTAEWVERKQRMQRFLGDEIYDGGAFVAKLRLSDVDRQEIQIFRKLGDGSEVKLPVSVNRFTRLSKLPFSYRHEADFTLRKERGKLISYRRRWWRSLKFETIYLGVIALNWRLHTMKERLDRLKRYNLTLLSPKQKLIEIVKPFAFSVEAVAMIPKALLLRLLYHVMCPFMDKRQPIWLVSDRGVAARDNGEALYRYLLDQADVPADVYFVIAKQSHDYDRIVGLGGKVLRQGSLSHQLMFLFASKVISSQADIETDNPYIRQIDHYVDLFRFDFVFLQHGVIRHDLSGWLNRFEKNIALFITSSEAEYQSLLDLPYYYDKTHLLLSGLPRYDLLENHPTNKIMLAPTYRKRLVRKKTDKNGIRGYDPEFKNTEYRRFYNSLINNERLRGALKDNGMEGELYLHPNFAFQAPDFDENEQFAVKRFPHNYQQAISQSVLFVSDFSSVVFDFAYLKKPVVYAQFDRKTFFDDQLYTKSSFFDDGVDGFGPVAVTLDDVVDQIVEIIEGGCIMEDKYKQKVDEFYRWHDRGARARVYRAILAMDN